MENATRRIPYALKLLEVALSRERANLFEFEGNLTSTDPMVVRQARGSIGSCQSRVGQLETALLDLVPPVPKQTEEVAVKIE